jgi:hypothetical protein
MEFAGKHLRHTTRFRARRPRSSTSLLQRRRREKSQLGLELLAQKCRNSEHRSSRKMWFDAGKVAEKHWNHGARLWHGRLPAMADRIRNENSWRVNLNSERMNWRRAITAHVMDRSTDFIAGGGRFFRKWVMVRCLKADVVTKEFSPYPKCD